MRYTAQASAWASQATPHEQRALWCCRTSTHGATKADRQGCAYHVKRLQLGTCERQWSVVCIPQTFESPKCSSWWCGHPGAMSMLFYSAVLQGVQPPST